MAALFAKQAHHKKNLMNKNQFVIYIFEYIHIPSEMHFLLLLYFFAEFLKFGLHLHEKAEEEMQSSFGISFKINKFKASLSPL